MLAEWDVAFDLVTPSGTLQINQTQMDGSRWQLVPSKCAVSLPVRSTEDDIPQADGKIPHRRWRSGYGVHLALEPFEQWNDGDNPTLACGETLVDMVDALGLHTNEMIRTGLAPGLPNSRLIWTPTGKARRMFDRLQLQSDPVLTVTEGELGGAQVEVDFDTAFPYYISEQETDTVIGGTSTEVITNEGNSDFFCVAQLNGESNYCELINHTVVDLNGNPLKVVYFAALPGASVIDGGDYVELVFFNGTAFLNGDQARRLAGVDFRYTTFFPLVPGDNVIEAVGASVLIKSNSAWA